MEEHVLERNLQEVLDAEGAALRGDDGAVKVLLNRLMGFIRHPSKWQWVIHGETALYRGWVVQWLMGQERYKMARRFALCGRGDIALCREDAQAARVKPQGCGARFCPRCSRRFGRRFLARVASHLSSRPHGGLWHVVLTQQVLPYEDLEHSRERFGIAWKRAYAGLRKIGMRSGLATYHVKRSRGGGWHYHCHLIVEWKEGVDGERARGEVESVWNRAKKEPLHLAQPLWGREICAAGPALVGLAEEKQMEFWQESTDAVEVALQYVLRDVLQGVEGWIGGVANGKEAEAFAGALDSAKLHRMYGEWRTAVVEEVDEDKETEGSTEAERAASVAGKEVTVWKAIGGMDAVLMWARNGDTIARKMLIWLVGARSCVSGAMKRLQIVVQECCG